jgi:hypothetical protein
MLESLERMTLRKMEKTMPKCECGKQLCSGDHGIQKHDKQSPVPCLMIPIIMLVSGFILMLVAGWMM